MISFRIFRTMKDVKLIYLPFCTDFTHLGHISESLHRIRSLIQGSSPPSPPPPPPPPPPLPPLSERDIVIHRTSSALGGEGLEDKDEDRKATRSEGMGLEESASCALMRQGGGEGCSGEVLETLSHTLSLSLSF